MGNLSCKLLRYLVSGGEFESLFLEIINYKLYVQIKRLTLETIFTTQNKYVRLSILMKVNPVKRFGRMEFSKLVLFLFSIMYNLKRRKLKRNYGKLK